MLATDHQRLEAAGTPRKFCSKPCYNAHRFVAKETRICEECAEPFTRSLKTLNVSARKRGRKARYCSPICRGAALQKAGTAQGTYLDKSGYCLIRDGGKYVYEHRHVMGRMVGRALLAHESVHHKNGIRTDNDPSNLELWDKTQPAGQRVSDKIAWAVEFLKNHEDALEQHGYSLSRADYSDHLSAKYSLNPMLSEASNMLSSMLN